MGADDYLWGCRTKRDYFNGDHQLLPPLLPQELFFSRELFFPGRVLHNLGDSILRRDLADYPVMTASL